MADLPFGTSAYTRKRGGLPELPVVNMFAEAAPTAEGGVTLQSRPGMEIAVTVGLGPIQGGYQADGVFEGARFVVSGGRLFRGGTDLGAIIGDAPVSIAASPSEILVSAGRGIYSYNGTDLVRVTFPDDAHVIRVAYVAGYFIALRRDTQQWHFSKVLDGRSWDGFDFANAENEPDRLVDAVVVDDVLVLLGTASVEFWPKTGDATLPFAPTAGKVFAKGAIAAGCAVPFDNTFAYIGVVAPVEEGEKPTLRVFIAANVPQGISEPGIEERLAESSTFALFGLSFEGHEFLVVRLDRGSWLFDAATKQWCEFQSYGRANWRAASSIGGLLGDDETGRLWRLTGYADDGGPLERRFRAGLPIKAGSVSCDNLRLMTSPGDTAALASAVADPVVEMRSSRDRGRTWAGWRPTKLGEQGEYRTRVEWRRNGMFDDPGGLFEFRCTDPVPFGASGVAMNVPGGGRGR